MSDPVVSHPTNGFRIRPRFEQTLPLSPDKIRAQICAPGASKAEEFEIKSTTGMVVIHIAEKNRNRWSPRLQISLEKTAEGGTHIEGVYGPEHEVWALFIYVYIVTGLLGIFSGIYGSAQMFIGQMPWAWWVCGSMAVIAGSMYLLAQLGQKLGAWQTFELHHVYQAAMEPLVGAQGALRD